MVVVVVSFVVLIPQSLTWKEGVSKHMYDIVWGLKGAVLSRAHRYARLYSGKWRMTNLEKKKEKKKNRKFPWSI